MRKFFILIIFIFFSKLSFAQLYEGFFENDRAKMDLEQYELNSLSFVQSSEIDLDCQNYILVFDPKGYIHRLFLNDYVGKNYGQVKEINNSNIVIREIHKIGGGWEEIYLTIDFKK